MHRSMPVPFGRALALAAIVFTPFRASQVRVSGEPLVAGTYVLRSCKHACISGDTLGGDSFALLVLSDTTIAGSTLPDSARQYLGMSYMSLARLGRPNACYVSSNPGTPPTVGLSHWTPSGPNHVHVALSRSPDSGWDLDLSARGDAVDGSADSWHAGIIQRHDRRMPITGRLVGPPNMRPCADSAIAAERALERHG